MFKWISPVLSQTWLLVVGAFGVLVMLVKSNQRKSDRLEETQEDLETMKRLRDVQINDSRDASLERLRANGDLRD